MDHIRNAEHFRRGWGYMDIQIAFLHIKDDLRLWTFTVSSVQWWAGNIWSQWKQVRESWNYRWFLQKVSKTAAELVKQNIKSHSQYVRVVEFQGLPFPVKATGRVYKVLRQHDCLWIYKILNSRSWVSRHHYELNRDPIMHKLRQFLSLTTHRWWRVYGYAETLLRQGWRYHRWT